MVLKKQQKDGVFYYKPVFIDYGGFYDLESEKDNNYYSYRDIYTPYYTNINFQRKFDDIKLQLSDIIKLELFTAIKSTF